MHARVMPVIFSSLLHSRSYLNGSGDKNFERYTRCMIVKYN